jgi:(p)ppGpp synthase/HD superfamily hydrolase
MPAQEFLLYRLRVAADADPGALARVLERFQNLNIAPRRIIAEFGTNDTLHIQVDVFGLSEERLTLIAAKIGQVPSIVSAYWHRL